MSERAGGDVGFGISANPIKFISIIAAAPLKIHRSKVSAESLIKVEHPLERLSLPWRRRVPLQPFLAFDASRSLFVSRAASKTVPSRLVLMETFISGRRCSPLAEIHP